LPQRLARFRALAFWVFGVDFSPPTSRQLSSIHPSKGSIGGDSPYALLDALSRRRVSEERRSRWVRQQEPVALAQQLYEER
jgi:hypothetical protein